MVRYICLSYILITVLIYLKNMILPSLLFLTLPISDFRSKLFELLILIFGVLACFLFFSLGYIANRYFKIRLNSLIFYLHVLFLPFIISNWFVSLEWLKLWSDYAIDLIAEPYRLLTFTYPFSDFVGLALPVILITIGTMINLHDKTNLQTTSNTFEVESL